MVSDGVVVDGVVPSRRRNGGGDIAASLLHELLQERVLRVCVTVVVRGVLLLLIASTIHGSVSIRG